MIDSALIDRVVAEVLREKSLQRTLCKPGEDCHGCGLCVINKPEVVNTIVDSGAERISTGLGIDEAGGLPHLNLARLIDHTLLKPEATRDQIEQLCNEAKKYNFASVCINPCWVTLCAQLLKNTSVKVCTVIGFPLGASQTAVKVAEAEQAMRDGAEELDMVVNVGFLKSGDYESAENDIRAVVLAAHKHQALVKVILETCLLTDEEKVKASLLAKRAGADFVKTSTGFNKAGATVGDVALMRRVVGSAIGVKAAGGVRTREEAEAMVQSGADRVGASASVKIVTQA
jgi:deoxyribose-phosphate aldolase